MTSTLDPDVDVTLDDFDAEDRMVIAAPEPVSVERYSEPKCPRARPTPDQLEDAVRCYHDRCGHLFYDDTKSVLCPCCR